MDILCIPVKKKKNHWEHLRTSQCSHDFFLFKNNLKKDYSRNYSQACGAEQALVQRKHRSAKMAQALLKGSTHEQDMKSCLTDKKKEK